MPKTEAIQDSIDFVLAVEETVVNTTVKMVATISGMVTPGVTEESLKADIRRMMKRFIKDAAWNFAQVLRESHPSGLEQINLQASARVSESENYALDKRSREVSQDGLSIVSVYADTAPPPSMIEETESRLRVALLTKAQKELGVINKAMGDTYRVGAVAFQAAAQPNLRLLSNKTANASSYGSGFGRDANADDPDALGNAVKLTMRANVSFRKIVG